MIIEPHSNVKAPMVRKPVRMIKPRVVTLKKSLHDSLERRQQGLKVSSSGVNFTKNNTGSIPFTQYERNLIGKSSEILY